MAKRSKYRHVVFCYGMPVETYGGFITMDRVWKEGKRKKYCRTCLNHLVEEFRRQVIKELKRLGAK